MAELKEIQENGMRWSSVNCEILRFIQSIILISLSKMSME